MEATLHNADCLDVLRSMNADSVDAVVTDPPYAEIDRPYGRLTEADWHKLMNAVVEQVRRILKPKGSAVFVLQPNSERVGKMRPWLFEFMAKWTREWNMVQDAWWWNWTASPTVHCQRKRGLMRPSVKACVWLGEPDCYRNQDAVLIPVAEATKTDKRINRMDLQNLPSGQSIRAGRMIQTCLERGGSTPFNLIACSNSNGTRGHGASTPYALTSWWVRYLTPLGGVVLDPFMGCGTTGIAALQEGFRFVGIEREAEYIEIAKRRIHSEQPTLFSGDA